MRTFATHLRNKSTGEMAEWSIAAVLKTVELRGSGGSNPSLSAAESCKSQDLRDYFYSDFRVLVKVRLLCPNKRH